MPYERSLQIEARLKSVLQLIAKGKYSTSELAAEIGVSVPTISRDVTALRQRGYEIRAKRHGMLWHYVLSESTANHKERSRRRRKGIKPR